MQASEPLDRLEQARYLDPVVNALRPVVDKAMPQPVKDVLHGVWLGHPVHPLLTDVTIGCWMSASLLDFVPGTGGASATLVAAGLVSAVPTAATGLADWSSLNPAESRSGLVHAAVNTTGLLLYAGSLLARARRRRVRGRALALAGLGAVTFGGLIGGHLSYRRAVGANHAADTGDTASSGWSPVGMLDDLPEGTPVQHQLGQVPVLVLRQGREVHAIVGRCTHQSGPLAEGDVVTEGGETCVVCPWHGSTFRVRDGAVVHGPATAPQPTVQSRVSGGQVEVRVGG